MWWLWGLDSQGVRGINSNGQTTTGKKKQESGEPREGNMLRTSTVWNAVRGSSKERTKC